MDALFATLICHNDKPLNQRQQQEERRALARLRSELSGETMSILQEQQISHQRFLFGIAFLLVLVFCPFSLPHTRPVCARGFSTAHFIMPCLIWRRRPEQHLHCIAAHARAFFALVCTHRIDLQTCIDTHTQQAASHSLSPSRLSPTPSSPSLRTPPHTQPLPFPSFTQDEDHHVLRGMPGFADVTPSPGPRRGGA